MNFIKYLNRSLDAEYAFGRAPCYETRRDLYLDIIADRIQVDEASIESVPDALHDMYKRWWREYGYENRVQEVMDRFEAIYREIQRMAGLDTLIAAAVPKPVERVQLTCDKSSVSDGVILRISIIGGEMKMRKRASNRVERLVRAMMYDDYDLFVDTTMYNAILLVHFMPDGLRSMYDQDLDSASTTQETSQ